MLLCLTQVPLLMLVQSALQGKGGTSESRLDAGTLSNMPMIANKRPAWNSASQPCRAGLLMLWYNEHSARHMLLPTQ